MPSLDDEFKQLAARLKEPASLSASRSDPFYYFAYHPEKSMEVRRKLPVWTAQLRNDGLQVTVVSFSEILWELIDASGRWEAWLEAEPFADRQQVNDAVRDVVRSGDALVERIASLVGTPRPDHVVFLIDTEMLHPYFRVRILENALHDRVRIPTVVFYPGLRAGQFGLRFLGFYDEDSNYRATLIGGLP